MDYMDVIESRWAVRYFLDREVEKEKIDLLLDAARKAPSWKNLKCWRFIVINDRNLICKMVDEGAIHERNSWAMKAPVLIVAVADPEKSGHYNGMDYYLVDTAIALTHLYLAAVDQGLGGCWIGIYDESKVKVMLSIPDNMKVVGLIPIGYPDWEKVKSDTKRVEMHKDKLSRGECAYHNTYGHSWK